MDRRKGPDRRDVLKATAAAGALAIASGGAEKVLHNGQVKDAGRTLHSEHMPEADIEKREDRFTREFKKREMLEVGAGGVAEVVDVSPHTPSDKSPIYFDPSTLVPIDVYEYVFRDFVKEGRRMIGINHPRIGGTTELSAADRDVAEKIPPEQLRQALTDIQVLDAKNVEGINMLGHSQRGVSVVIAALLMKRRAERGEGVQRAKNVVLFESAGLVGKDTLARLGYGFLAEPSTRGKWGESFEAMPWSEEEKTRVEKENAERAAGGEKPIILPDYHEIVETAEDREKGATVKKEQYSQYSPNAGRAWAEISQLTKIDLRPYLEELRSSGIGVIVISGASDKVFPMEKLAGTMDKTTGEITPGTLNTKNVDIFLPFRGDHALRVPQVPYIEGWLSEWEKKQGRDKAAGR